jgi:hypothetical protein
MIREWDWLGWLSYLFFSWLPVILNSSAGLLISTHHSVPTDHVFQWRSSSSSHCNSCCMLPSPCHFTVLLLPSSRLFYCLYLLNSPQTNRSKRTHCGEGNILYSALQNMEATSHMWQLSTWNESYATLILKSFHLYHKCCIWLRLIILGSTAWYHSMLTERQLLSSRIDLLKCVY